MGSSQKESVESAEAGTAGSSGLGAAESPQHREYEKPTHRGVGPRDRRKRSRERGADTGSSSLLGEIEARGGCAHGLDRGQAEPVEPKVETASKTATSSKTSSGHDSSVRIKEANKRQAGLGLKPLELSAAEKETGRVLLSPMLDWVHWESP
uniref:Uncharacterized protein n=1 Tax=Vombatus ursinus TaxID=29139 RepID=A0A4X2KBE9_VOMUR